MLYIDSCFPFVERLKVCFVLSFCYFFPAEVTIFGFKSLAPLIFAYGVIFQNLFVGLNYTASRFVF